MLYIRLRYIADKYEVEYPRAAEFVRNSFYVDDGLISVSTVEALRVYMMVKQAKARFQISSRRILARRFKPHLKVLNVC